MVGVLCPEERTSAAQILFAAEGFTTPKGQILPLMPLAIPVQIPLPRSVISVDIPDSVKVLPTLQIWLQTTSDLTEEHRQGFTSATVGEPRHRGSKENRLDSGIRKQELKRARFCDQKESRWPSSQSIGFYRSQGWLFVLWLLQLSRWYRGSLWHRWFSACLEETRQDSSVRIH